MLIKLFLWVVHYVTIKPTAAEQTMILSTVDVLLSRCSSCDKPYMYSSADDWFNENNKSNCTSTAANVQKIVK